MLEIILLYIKYASFFAGLVCFMFLALYTIFAEEEKEKKDLKDFKKGFLISLILFILASIWIHLMK